MAKKSNSVAVVEDWQVESDLRTMIECEQIEKDPKRLAAVRKLAKERLLSLASVAAEKSSET